MGHCLHPSPVVFKYQRRQLEQGILLRNLVELKALTLRVVSHTSGFGIIMLSRPQRSQYCTAKHWTVRVVNSETVVHARVVQQDFFKQLQAHPVVLHALEGRIALPQVSLL
jgi:hypothetical protein